MTRMEFADNVPLLNYFKNLSMIQVAAVSFIVITSLLLFIQKISSWTHSPPGPWGFPIVGHLPLLGKKPFITFMEMRKKYGDIIGLKLGSWPTVVLNGNVIKEAFVSHGDAFSGRPQFFSSVSLQNGKSLSFGKFDSSWKLHRRIANNSLIEFASAKTNPIEGMISEEVSRLQSEFEEYGGKPFDPHDQIFMAVASVIYQICYGQKECVRMDEDFREYILHTEDFSRFAAAGNLVDIFPWTRLFFGERTRAFKVLLEKGRLIRQKRIKEHLDTFDGDHLRDITDFLISSCNSLTESDKEAGMTKDRVMNTIGDMFAAGFDTVATTSLWSILVLTKHRRVQKKIQAELDEFVGMSRAPAWADRKKLVYLEATINEIMRIISLVPLSTAHSTTTDVSLGGFTIKKGTLVFPNLYSLSHDPIIWGDPDTFRPERFLTDSGGINSTLLDKFLPFSTGRRRCIGETLARMELFLILSGLLQRFDFVKPESVPDYTMDCHFGLNLKPLPYKVECHVRT